MENNYLEIASSKQNVYDDMEIGNPGLQALIKVLKGVLPKKVTPVELITYLELIINDVRKEKCGFNNSKKVFEDFGKLLAYSGNIDMILTWLPGWLELIASKEFLEEFLSMYKEVFFGARVPESEQDYGCIEVSPDMIDISNKNKADVLAALYNNSKPMGAGLAQYDSTPMTRELAQYALDKFGYHFDYLKGRPLKINLNEDIIFVAAYNRDNNDMRLAQKAISSCPNVSRNL